MREMKDSGVRWIGKIPTKWTIAKAKNCVEIQNGSDPKTEGSIPVYGSGSMSFKTCGEYKEGPSVLIGRKGATLHIPHYISSKFWNVDTAFNVYSKSIFDLKYYFYCAHVFDYTLYMSQTTLPSMTQTAYENMFLPLPTKEEQYAIANQLDQICSKIDAVLEKTRASIEEYKKLKQAVITQAVTKGIRGDMPMKDSGIEWIGDIPAEWRKTQLRHCAAIKSGITLGKKYEKTDSLVERPYLRVANVQDGYVDLSVLTTIEVTQDEDLKYRLRAGDVLMTEGGDRDKLGRGCVWHGEIEPCLHQNHIFAVQTSKDTLLPEFLEYLTVSDVGRSYFDVTAIKTTNLACTSSSKVLAFTIPLPSVEEQAEIVEALNTKCAGIDALVAKKQQYLTEIENYKKSLIYEYVTGKKEVV